MFAFKIFSLLCCSINRTADNFPLDRCYPRDFRDENTFAVSLFVAF